MNLVNQKILHCNIREPNMHSEPPGDMSVLRIHVFKVWKDNGLHKYLRLGFQMHAFYKGK